MRGGEVRAICYGSYGDADQLYMGEQQLLCPQPHEVVTRVAAAAVNPIDWKLRKGQARLIYPLKFPVTPGYDFCGTILGCGEKVRDFAPGDRVCGMSDQRAGGAFAECCLCSADALAKVPDGMPDEEAAGLPLAGLTALQGLRDHGKFEAGMRVMIIGASGGVGHLAVQIAARRGGRVTAVCGPGNQDWVGGLGAEAVLNYHDKNWLEKAGTFDLIFDAVGSVGFRAARAHLVIGGSYVCTLPGAAIFMDQWLRAPLHRRRARTFLAKPSGDDLRELIADWVAERLRVRVERVYDWQDFGEAFARSESGHARGKIVLRVDGA